MAVLRKDVPENDKWNLESLYPSFNEWEKERERLTMQESPPFFPQMEKFRNSLYNSPKDLLQALDTYFGIERILRKLYTYAHLRHDENIVDNDAKHAYEIITSLYHAFAQETSWLQPELLHAPNAKLDEFLTNPLLKEYHFFLEKLARLKKPHSCSRTRRAFSLH